MALSFRTLDWSIASIVGMLLAIWLIIMCIFVFWGPSNWKNGLYNTSAVFIFVISLAELLTGTIQKSLTKGPDNILSDYGRDTT